MPVPGFASHPSPSDREFEQAALAEADRLYRVALRLVRDKAGAEDLVQDTYVKAFRSAGRFEWGTNIRAWLFTILMNTWRNRRRDAGRDPVEVDSERVNRAGLSQLGNENPEELLLRATLGADLSAALDGLPPAFREAVWLRDVEEFTYGEIAGILGVPTGTVMSRISRGRRQLYQRLTAGVADTATVGASGRG
jgi:RNA polymerase sigma-70 factor, ECF subfamily